MQAFTDAPKPEKYEAAVSIAFSGCQYGRGGRQDNDIAGTGSFQELPIDLLAPRRPLGATDQSELAVGTLLVLNGR